MSKTLLITVPFNAFQIISLQRNEKDEIEIPFGSEHFKKTVLHRSLNLNPIYEKIFTILGSASVFGKQFVIYVKFLYKLFVFKNRIFHIKTLFFDDLYLRRFLIFPEVKKKRMRCELCRCGFRE